MTNLFEPPPKYTLPLAKGGDLVIDFQNDPNNDGTYVNYGAGVTVTLVIDTGTPIEAEAEISTYHAVVKIESAVADMIPNETVWRLIYSSPTDPTTETVAAFGKTKRYDG